MSNDYRCFKFRTINKHLIESLVRPSLYFARPDTLNDPFDCRLNIRSSFERATTIASGDRKTSLTAALRHGNVLEKFEEQFKNFGVCSFSLLEGSFDEPLLWSHYADRHRGLCLLYRFPMAFLDDPERIIGVDKVRYDNDILTNWLVNSSTSPDDPNFVIELTQVYLTAKSEAWRNEKEARIIRSTDGIFDIPRGFLEQVCFGLRTPQADIDLITELAREYSGCNKFCQVVRADTDFGITAKEL